MAAKTGCKLEMDAMWRFCKILTSFLQWFCDWSRLNNDTMSVFLPATLMEVLKVAIFFFHRMWGNIGNSELSLFGKCGGPPEVRGFSGKVCTPLHIPLISLNTVDFSTSAKYSTSLSKKDFLWSTFPNLLTKILKVNLGSSRLTSRQFWEQKQTTGSKHPKYYLQQEIGDFSCYTPHSIVIHTPWCQLYPES